jgi:hypothetical protein
VGGNGILNLQGFENEKTDNKYQLWILKKFTVTHPRASK